MNATETLKPATDPINIAHEVLMKSDEALCVEEVARAILGGDKPTKAYIKDAAKLLKQLADLGMIEMEPRAGGVPFYRLIAAPAVGDSEGGETDAPASGVCEKCLGSGFLPKAMSLLELLDAKCPNGCKPPIDAQRAEFSLLGLLADIRAAAGDPDGRLMQDELVQHIARVVKERDDLRERLDAQIKQWQADTGRLAADLRAAMESRSQAINEADRLRAELATERQAREALQEQSDAVDVKDAAVGYLVRVPKRAPILRRKPESARSAALSAVRAGASRAEVLAVVPVGTARRGAEWQSTEAGG